MKATIIGSNSLACSLAMALEKADIKVGEIYDSDIRQALRLSERLYAAIAVNSLNFELSKSDIFIVCLEDELLETAVSGMSLPPGSLILITSGIKSLKMIEEKQGEYSFAGVKAGVLFPVYRFGEESLADLREIPFLIEAADEEDYQLVSTLAKKLSKKVSRVDHRQRMIYSCAMAFAVDFTTHLWALSKEVLESEDLDFDWLKPIIEKNVKEVLQSEHPADCQSGPALEDDAETINNHIAILSDSDDLVKVYTVLTESILDWHSED